jgi:hypothetical protein
MHDDQRKVGGILFQGHNVHRVKAMVSMTEIERGGCGVEIETHEEHKHQIQYFLDSHDSINSCFGINECSAVPDS